MYPIAHPRRIELKGKALPNRNILLEKWPTQQLYMTAVVYKVCFKVKILSSFITLIRVERVCYSNNTVTLVSYHPSYYYASGFIRFSHSNPTMKSIISAMVEFWVVIFLIFTVDTTRCEQLTKPYSSIQLSKKVNFSQYYKSALLRRKIFTVKFWESLAEIVKFDTIYEYPSKTFITKQQQP